MLLRSWRQKQKISLKLFRVLAAVVVLASLGFLQFKGVIWHNSFFAKSYSVKGLDVARYQGNIDWNKVRSTNLYRFVYIKATEGRDLTDPYFNRNWTEASRRGFAVGAYHFFTTQSTGEQQADHYIATVPKEDDTLPPVIDIEIALDKDVSGIREQLTALINKLEQHYEQKPLLYVTYATYNTYIAGSFTENDIWIRDIVKSPKLKKDRDWLLWQYSNRGRVAGIDAYVDLNVFNGDWKQFDKRFKVGRYYLD
ncbi:glycoside hydrolase [Paenibacillus sp. NEAU-GSW1]|nr:glycoside hydrolase [Paenibacillus sp. NEAU-GSW1]